jgi:hypothetical protein
MPTAQGFIAVCPSHKDLAALLPSNKGRKQCWSPITTPFTQGREMRDFIGKGYKPQDITERLSIRVTIQTNYNHIFLINFYSMFNKL